MSGSIKRLMKIGVIGSGNIGKTLARKLAQAGHDVSVANSRGPETIDPETLAFGARAVAASEAVAGADAVILTIPFRRNPDVKPLFAAVPPGTVVIDTSNYYPFRDGQITALDAGQVESLWVEQQLGRPIAKAWNAILADTFREAGAPAGTPGRLSIPVAADLDEARGVAMQLVDDTGFDPFNAGPLSESWRFQPGQPAYCTGLDYGRMRAALDAADGEAGQRRDDMIRKMLDSGNRPFERP